METAEIQAANNVNLLERLELLQVVEHRTPNK